MAAMSSVMASWAASMSNWGLGAEPEVGRGAPVASEPQRFDIRIQGANEAVFFDA
jgi:hypothetical protein